MATSTRLEGLNLARAVARFQGRCPGVPLDGGGYSGCRGGADCPVCGGEPIATIDASAPPHRPLTAEEMGYLREEGLVYVAPRIVLRLLASHDLREAERDALQAAARALLDDVESPSGEPMGFCHALRCRRLAMCGDGDMVACDEHQGILVAGDIEDLSYAPAVRSLRSLLPKEGA